MATISICIEKNITFCILNLTFVILDIVFENFVNQPCMSEIKDRSIFVHIDVPGHEENADTLPDS